MKNLKTDTDRLLDRCCQCGAMAGFQVVEFEYDARLRRNIKAACSECANCAGEHVTKSEAVWDWNKQQRDKGE